MNTFRTLINFPTNSIVINFKKNMSIYAFNIIQTYNKYNKYFKYSYVFTPSGDIKMIITPNHDSYNNQDTKLNNLVSNNYSSNSYKSYPIYK